MSSINQLVSEIAHSVKQADSVPVRRALQRSIIHGRNEVVRNSFVNNNTTDKLLLQRYKVSLIDVPDGDLESLKDQRIIPIKRSVQKIPRPTRLSKAVPFNSVRTVGSRFPIVIPFIREFVSQFYKHLPGMCGSLSYDYLNEYMYINASESSLLATADYIIIESVFENPHLIEMETIDGKNDINDVDFDDEFLIPEDMVNAVKKLALEIFNVEVVRDTNEINNINLVK